MTCILEHSIRLARAEHLTSDVKVKLLRRLDSLRFSEKTFGPIGQGEVVELPRILANILVKRGIATYVNSEVSVREIRMLAHTQKTKGKAKSLDRLFYRRAISSLLLLSRDDPSEAKKGASELLDLVEKRARIIVRMAFAGLDEEAKKTLTEEEYGLYAEVKGLLHAWREVFMEVMRRIE